MYDSVCVFYLYDLYELLGQLMGSVDINLKVDTPRKIQTNFGLKLLCLTTFSTIFQLYRDGQFC